jgi:hypothetical protein
MAAMLPKPESQMTPAERAAKKLAEQPTIPESNPPAPEQEVPVAETPRPITLDELRNMSNAPDSSEPRPITLDELRNMSSTGETPTPAPTPERSPTDVLPELPEGESLKLDDLRSGPRAQVLRNYMVQRMGNDYLAKDDAEVADDFVTHMRWFETNTVFTTTEARWVYNADDKQKETARKAFELYDQVGNVFTNDGIMGALGGVTDYVFAAAADPINYLGLLTGGLAKAGAVGASQGGKALVRRGLVEAGKKHLASGVGKEAALKLAQQDTTKLVAKIVEKEYAQTAAEEVAKRAAKLITAQSERTVRREGAKIAATEALKKASTKSLAYQALGNGVMNVVQDYQIQSLRMDVGAQEEYSAASTIFSGALGLALGGGIGVVAGSGKGVSGLGDTRSLIAKSKAQEFLDTTSGASPILKFSQSKKVSENIQSVFRSWKEKHQAGAKMSDSQVTSPELLRDIILGKTEKIDGKDVKVVDGLIDVLVENGFKKPKNMMISDVLTNMTTFMDPKDLHAINIELKDLAGFSLGEAAGLRVGLSDLLASDIRRSAQSLNVLSQANRLYDLGIVAGKEALNMQDRALMELEAGTIEKTVAKEPAAIASYAQSFWRRMLVSSPATTAANVMGFGGYYVGQSLADLFNMTGHAAFAALTGAGATKTSREAFRKARVYGQIQAQKIRNLMDPFTTHDAYMAFLDNNKTLSKTLFETVTGGVERSADRFNINKDAKWFKVTEALANGANQITGVRIQDSFTKSQMFINEIDKNLRLTKGKTLQEVLSEGTLDNIDEGVLNATLDTTLKSVFSKDYTKGDQSPMIKSAAKLTESLSNTPILGTVLPFGRFFNNIVGFAYQHSVGGVPAVMKGASSIMKGRAVPLETTEAIARSTVGIVGIAMFAMADDERQAKNLGTFDVEGAGGIIIDARNTFPMSLFLVAGRVANKMGKGEVVPPELKLELLEQLGIGNLAKDVEFGNDLRKLTDGFLNEDASAMQSSMDQLYKSMGSMAAGVTRPLDFANRMVGYVANNDTMIDPRQETGAGLIAQSSSKYINNIITLMTDKVDSLTGEELRVATRVGKVYDPSPLARGLGITIKQGRSNTEIAYAMAGMETYKANERTQVASYDRLVNEAVAPILERNLGLLINSPKWRSATDEGKRSMLKQTLSSVKKVAKEFIGATAGQEDQLDIMRVRINRKAGGKEIANEAIRLMREKRGFSGGLKDMNISELFMYERYIEYLKLTYSMK